MPHDPYGYNDDPYGYHDGHDNTDYTPPPNTGVPQPGGFTGDQEKDRARAANIFGEIFKWGVDAALSRLGLTNDDLDRLLEGQGLSPEQISNLKEHEQFRNGIRSGELPSPELRSALDDIEGLEGRMNIVLDQGGRTDRTETVADRATDLVTYGGLGPPPTTTTPGGVRSPTTPGRSRSANVPRVGRDETTTPSTDPLGAALRRGLGAASDIVDAGGQTAELQELYKLGSDLVKDRGFTPEFRDAFDRLLDVVAQDHQAVGISGETSAFSPALNALQRIVKSEGREGAGILPLEQVVGLIEAQAGERSAQMAVEAQKESARRGLGPGAVTSGTTVAAESGQFTA